MRHSISRALLGLSLFALACQGKLVDPDGGGTPTPPPANPPALALRIGGTGVDNLTDVVTDGLGNIYVAGSFSGVVDFDPGTGITSLVSLGSSDAFVASYSAAGNLLWVSRLGGDGTETASALARNAAGNLIVGGGFTGATDFDPGPGIQAFASLGGEDAYVTALSSAGTFIWARRFGGGGLDRVEDVSTDAGGNVYAAGFFAGEATTLPAAGPTIASLGGFDGFVLAFDPAGTVRWATPIGGTDNDKVTAVAVTTDGSVAVAGSFRASANFGSGSAAVVLGTVGGSDAFVASYTGDGGLRWVRPLTGTADQEVPPGGISAGVAGGVAVSGTFAGTVDLNPGSATMLRSSLGDTDWFVVRLDAGGAFDWAFVVGGNAAAAAPRPAFDADGTLLVVGSFAGAVDFDPGSGTLILTSLATAGSDAFAARYAAGGGLLWIKRFGEGTAAPERVNTATSLATDASGSLLVAGRFFGTPDFDPGVPTFRLLSLGEADGFVLRLTAAGALATIP